MHIHIFVVHTNIPVYDTSAMWKVHKTSQKYITQNVVF